jgi:hypothetical protein
MKHILLLIGLSFITFSIHSQILPFVDYNDYLKVFYMGQPRQLEYQRIQSFAFGDNILAYTDSKNDLKFYDGKNIQTATNMMVNYKVSDTYLAFRVSNALYYIENNKPRNLTMFAGNFIVKDSLIVFEDIRYNTWNIVYKGSIAPLYQATGELKEPAFVGDNIIIFKDNGDVYRVFYKGRLYEFGVWLDPIKFSVGTNIACFNDPTMGTFAVFENGEFMDVEPQFVKSYKTGRNAIVYEDINGNLMYYSKGKKAQLSNFPKTYDVVDEAILFTENNYTYTFYNGEKTLVCNYVPKDYMLKNKVIVFRNIMGGVSAFVDGKTVELTTQQDSEYEISGNYILVKLFNRSYLVYADGQLYTMN